MITLIDGVPGAGKSYYLVREIALKHQDYYKVFTNVNEFKFDAFDNVFPFELSKFVDLMIECKRLYDSDKSDADILAYLVSKEFLFTVDNPKPVFIVVDEIHNILGKSSDLWTWVLTYHRHLYIDFLFATQDYTLIYNKYYKLFQKIYRALPNSRSLRFRSNRYQEHLKLPIADGKTGTFLRNVYIKKEDRFYNLYKAGDAVRAKSVFSRFIWLFLLLGLIVFLAFFSFIHHLRSASSTTFNVEHNVTYVSRPSYSDFSDYRYLRVDCYLSICSFDSYSFNFDDLEFLLKHTDSRLVSSVVRSSSATLFLFVTSDFLNLFKRGNYEKSAFPFRS